MDTLGGCIAEDQRCEAVGWAYLKLQSATPEDKKWFLTAIVYRLFQPTSDETSRVNVASMGHSWHMDVGVVSS